MSYLAAGKKKLQPIHLTTIIPVPVGCYSPFRPVPGRFGWFLYRDVRTPINGLVGLRKTGKEFERELRGVASLRESLIGRVVVSFSCFFFYFHFLTQIHHKPIARSAKHDQCCFGGC